MYIRLIVIDHNITSNKIFHRIALWLQQLYQFSIPAITNSFYAMESQKCGILCQASFTQYIFQGSSILQHVYFQEFYSFPFRLLIHFEFTFAYGVTQRSNFILLHVDIQFSQNHLLKKLFIPLNGCGTLAENQLKCMCEFISRLFIHSIGLYVCLMLV